jgi:ABC-type spermidine/putrescine transport system permease subunit II
MARRRMTAGMVATLCVIGLLGAATLYVAAPIVLIGLDAVGEVRPGGFGRGYVALILLSARSVEYAIVPAALATGICTAASLVGRFSRTFRLFYRTWTLAMLFTNPVFFVLGFAILLTPFSPGPAVLLATTYVLLPLCGVIVQAAVEQYPRTQIATARALGDAPFGIACRHILPAVAPQLSVCLLLATLYALGFYLVPSYVGLGRVVTLATTIDHTANQVGDWNAACQLCLVALAVQSLLVGIWFAVPHWTWRRVTLLGQVG